MALLWTEEAGCGSSPQICLSRLVAGLRFWVRCVLAVFASARCVCRVRRCNRNSLKFLQAASRRSFASSMGDHVFFFFPSRPFSPDPLWRRPPPVPQRHRVH